MKTSPLSLSIIVAIFLCGGPSIATDDVIEASSFEDAPGCGVMNPAGTLQVQNLLHDIGVRVRIKGEFANPDGAPTSCGVPCATETCACSIALQNLDAPASTTQQQACYLCSSPESCTGCDNESEDCHTAGMFCVEASRVEFKLLAFSFDGQTWTRHRANAAADDELIDIAAATDGTIWFVRDRDHALYQLKTKE